LDLVWLDPHPLRQPLPAQFHHQIYYGRWIPSAHKEKVAVLRIPQFRHLSLIDGVRCTDDCGSLGLAEDFGKADHPDSPATDEVAEHVPWPHGRQLILVSHQDQAAVWAHGGQ